ncbi:MAG: HAD-IC family P-type ATPase, partial [Haloferacaceae archaeon]
MRTCRLCDLPTPDDPVTDPAVEGAFCCRGCLAVARTLDDPGDADPSAVRDPSPDRPDGTSEAFLSVEGMHCTTCEAFLARRAESVDGVHAVEANYATGMARVCYDPDRVDAGALPERLSGRGYAFRDPDADPAGADRTARRRRRDAFRRLLVGGFFTMLLMPWYLFYLYPGYVGIETGILTVDTTTPVGVYLPLALVGLMAGVVVLYTGAPVLRGAAIGLRARRPNMDLLVAVAALGAYGYSTVALAAGSTHLYYDVAVAVVMAVTLGRYHESGVRSRAAGALSDLAAARTDEATRLTAAGRETVPVGALAPGDEVVVAPGERVPVDGTVREGVAAVDESVLTGESVPVTRRPGDGVVGGAVVTDDALVVEVDAPVGSAADRVAATLWEIQSGSSGARRLADALASVFVPLVIALGALTLGWRLATGAPPAAALLAGLAVVVVSCPCALGLATPLATVAGLRDALRRGVAVRNAAVFELAPDADAVLFDKTGTLTAGEMRVTGVHGDDRSLALAAAVERLSEHPVADAVLDACRDPPDGDGTGVGEGERGTRRAGAGDGPRTAGAPDTAPDGGGTAGAPAPDAATPDAIPEAREFARHPGAGVSARVA